MQARRSILMQSSLNLFDQAYPELETKVRAIYLYVMLVGGAAAARPDIPRPSSTYAHTHTSVPSTLPLELPACKPANLYLCTYTPHRWSETRVHLAREEWNLDRGRCGSSLPPPPPSLLQFHPVRKIRKDSEIPLSSDPRLKKIRERGKNETFCLLDIKIKPQPFLWLIAGCSEQCDRGDQDVYTWWPLTFYLIPYHFLFSKEGCKTA